MIKVRKALVLLIFACIFTLLAQPARASLLRLGAEPSTYTGEVSDTWFTESWITGPGVFTLQVINDYNPGAQDSYINTIEDVYLVIAVKEETKALGFNIDLNGDTLTEGDFTSSGDHPYVPRHGVLEGDTYYYDYFLGDIAPSSFISLDMDIESPGIVHFDAYGDLVYKSGRDGYEKNSITNPFSKDVTYNHTPEPATVLMLGLSGAFWGVLKSRSRKRR